MKLFPSFFTTAVSAGLLGTLLLGFGILLLLLWNTLFEFIIGSVLVVKPNSLTLDLWRKAPMPLAMDFYFFNWTNPEEIHNPGNKPLFKEMGPYRFIEDREKVNLTWNSNNTISYRLLRHWYFDETNSVGKLTDQITTLNPVTMSAANQVKNWSYFMKRGFSLTLAAIAPNIEITKSVIQLLFDGYQDPYIDIALTLPFLTETLPPFDKFGWFYSRNESYTFDGVFNMATGVDGNMGELLEWNYSNETNYYSGSCAKVYGSAAELYPKNRSRDNIGFFSQDMCRNVELDYESDVLVKNINGYKYSAQTSMLDNGTVIPDNKCYCNGECIPSGVLNVSSCRYNTPAFVSLPHFYNADASYADAVGGLQPEKSKHELYLTLEPKTGIPLDGAIRLQLNMLMSPIEQITLYENVPKVVFPLIWFEQTFALPDYVALMIQILLYAPTIFRIVAHILIVAGISLLLYAVVFKTICAKRSENNCLSREEVPLRSSTDESYAAVKRKLMLLDFIYNR